MRKKLYFGLSSGVGLEVRNDKKNFPLLKEIWQTDDPSNRPTNEPTNHPTDRQIWGVKGNYHYKRYLVILIRSLSLSTPRSRIITAIDSIYRPKDKFVCPFVFLFVCPSKCLFSFVSLTISSLGANFFLEHLLLIFEHVGGKWRFVSHAMYFTISSESGKCHGTPCGYLKAYFHWPPWQPGRWWCSRWWCGRSAPAGLLRL